MRNLVVVCALVVSLLGYGCECGDPESADAGRLNDGEVPDGGPFGFDAGPVPTGELAEGRVCTPGGWCWETPLPGGGNVTGLWSAEPGRLVAGSGTFMFHVEGDRIRHAAPPTMTPFLNAIPVWAASPDDVWSAGFGSLIHFDGSRWTETGTVRFSASLSGASGDDVWSTGFGAIHHFDGSLWTELDVSAYPDASFIDVWAIGPEEAIVVGGTAEESFVLHARGATLTDLGFPAGMGGGVVAVYASGVDDIWAQQGRSLWRRSGGAWSELDSSGFFIATPAGMWGSGPDDVWIADRAAVRHWDGNSLDTIPIDDVRVAVTAIAGTSPTDVWAADMDGQLHHYDGSTWSVRFKETVAPTDFRAISVGDDGIGWAVGPTGIAERAADGAWRAVASPTMAQLAGVARAGGESFLFADGGAYRRSGEAWELVIGGAGLRDACATDDGMIWAVGDTVATFTGGEWVPVPDVVVPSPLVRVECLGAEAWALPQAQRPDDGVSVLHYNGADWGLWGLESVAHLPILDAVAPSPDDGWVLVEAAAGQSVLMRYADGAWRQVAGAPTTARGVGATSPTEVWLVGPAGMARRFGGAGFEDLDAAGAPDLRWVGPGAGGATWALAESGEVWAFSGAGWSQVGGTLRDGGASSSTLEDVAFANGEAYGAGSSYEALRFDGATWSRIGTFGAQRVAANDAAGVWFVDLSRDVGRFDGTDIIEDTSLRSATDVVVPFAGNAVFAVERSEIYRYDGAGFVRDLAGEALDTAIFGAAPDSMWLLEGADARRERTRIWRRSATWEQVPSLHEPVGFGTDAMGRRLVVGADWSIWREEAAGLRQVIAPREGFERQRVAAAHAYDLADVWVLGLGGLIHFDGAAWTQLADAAGLGFNALEATPDGTLFAAGNGASVVVHQP